MSNDSCARQWLRLRVRSDRILKGALDVQGEPACVPGDERGFLTAAAEDGTARTCPSESAAAGTPNGGGAGDLLLRGRPLCDGLEPGLGRLLRLRARHRRELSGGRRHDRPCHPRDDGPPDPVRLRHPPSRGPRLREPGVHRAGRHRHRPHRCPGGDATARVRVLSRDVGPPGRRSQVARGLEGAEAGPSLAAVPNQLIFDDGNQRVELVHFGLAHTRGDAFAWIPQHKVLFHRRRVRQRCLELRR